MEDLRKEPIADTSLPVDDTDAFEPRTNAIAFARNGIYTYASETKNRAQSALRCRKLPRRRPSSAKTNKN